MEIESDMSVAVEALESTGNPIFLKILRHIVLIFDNL